MLADRVCIFFSLFSAMSRRRVACPQITQHLWDAIKIIRSQRQVPNVTRITRYMSRVHGAKEGKNINRIQCLDSLMVFLKVSLISVTLSD
jgi:hypothetical protein